MAKQKINLSIDPLEAMMLLIFLDVYRMEYGKYIGDKKTGIIEKFRKNTINELIGVMKPDELMEMAYQARTDILRFVRGLN